MVLENCNQHQGSARAILMQRLASEPCMASLQVLCRPVRQLKQRVVSAQVMLLAVPLKKQHKHHARLKLVQLGLHSFGGRGVAFPATSSNFPRRLRLPVTPSTWSLALLSS